MDGKKPLIILTGVAGRLGSKAAKVFSKSYQVVGFDICSPKSDIPGVVTYLADLTSLEDLKETFARIKGEYGDKILSVIHLAAYYNFEGGQWDKYQKITIDGTDNLLKALEEFEVRQIVFSSTLLVYEPSPPPARITETSPIGPRWEYPLSKIKTEELLKQKKEDASLVILRIAGIYDDTCNSIPISQHIKRIYEKQLESHFFPGNPSHGSSFLHLDDFIEALQMVVDQREVLPSVETYLLGEETLLTYRELQDQISRLLYGKKSWLIRIPKCLAKMGVFLQEHLPFFKKSFIKGWMIDLADDHYHVLAAKAHKKLGWKPNHSLESTLPKMITHLKEDPKNWYKKHGF